MKQNCWEFHKCGREADGEKVEEIGVCPVAEEQRCDGVNDGLNGGRCCWVIAGSFCDGEVQGTYAKKMLSCMACDFYKKVIREEGDEYTGVFKILSLLRKSAA